MTIHINKIPHDQNGEYTTYESSDFEFSDPIQYFKEIHVTIDFDFARKYLQNLFPTFPKNLIEYESRIQALKEWEKKYKEYLSIEIPKNFFDLLNADSKKKQLHLLKGQSITSDQLTAFIIRAFKDSGFTLSQYSAVHYPDEVNAEDLPLLTEINGDSVVKIGSTDLSNDQLKHIVKFRNVIISKILDRKLNWHCFFLTFKSIFGGENWNNSTPHLHYISDKFGLSRERVVKELKNKNYKLGNLPHINFIRYK